MTIKKFIELARFKHDRHYVEVVADKCEKIIDSCDTIEKCHNAISFVKQSKDMIFIKERLNEYPNFMLWLCRKVNRDECHSEFIDYVNSTFDKLNKRILEKIDELDVFQTSQKPTTDGEK